MTGVQLIGKGAVLSRYEKLQCDSWALFQGKQFIVGGVGPDSLSDWLTDLEKYGSTATYTLRVYDCNEAPTSSTGNTDYNACVAFKVVDTYEGYGIAGHSNKLMERIEGLETEIKKLNRPPDNDDDDDDDGGSIGAVVMDWLTNPEKLSVIVGVAKQIFNGGGAVPAVAAARPQTIGTTRMETEQISARSTEGLERIAKALDVLGECDPDLVTHLEKLAQLAQEDQLLFKAIISKLDAL